MERDIANVASGTEITITDHGKPIARIIPVVSDRLEQLVAEGRVIPPDAADTRLPARQRARGSVSDLDGDFPGGEVYRRWSPRPWPEWITFVPSRASTMPADLATALGAVLGLPVHDVVERVADRPPQATMDNSAQQLANVHDAFEVADEVPPALVLVAPCTLPT